MQPILALILGLGFGTCDFTFFKIEAANAPSQSERLSFARCLIYSDATEKGKPVERRGRKATGLRA